MELRFGPPVTYGMVHTRSNSLPRIIGYEKELDGIVVIEEQTFGPGQETLHCARLPTVVPNCERRGDCPLGTDCPRGC